MKLLDFEAIAPIWGAYFKHHEMEGRFTKDNVYTRRMVFQMGFGIVAEAHNLKDYDCEVCQEYEADFYEHPGDFSEIREAFVKHWNKAHRAPAIFAQ